jgi:hypothetical protein
MTYTSVTTAVAQYRIIGNELKLHLRADGTTGGTASTALTATLPFSAANYFMTFSANVGDTAFNGGGACYFNSASQIGICKQTEANWGLGASRRGDTSIFYSI